MSVPALIEPVDAGRGLRFHHGWLVSTPSATHVRWLAPWCQAVIAEVHNAFLLAVLTVRSQIRRGAANPLVRAGAEFAGAAVVVYVLMTVFGPAVVFYAGLVALMPLGWRLSVELTEAREVAR